MQYASRDPAIPGRSDLRRWARAALLKDAALTLRVVDEGEGRELNRLYRGKDYATNVLTFVYGPEDGYPEELLAGDIVLCAPVVAREAGEQDKARAAHYAHLVVHAALHLQGYNHETAAEAAAMEAVEGFIMRQLGFADPYR